MKVIKPIGLQPGDTIGVVAPAGPVNRERIDRALQRLRARGFHTKTYGDLYRSRGYLAGDDATRAEEFMAAFADPDTAAVWCARGGYGVARILDRLDFEVVRRNPKVFVGFSDISALHLAIQQRVGLVTFHAPNLQDGFGADADMAPAAESALWRAVMAQHVEGGDSGYVFSEANVQPICGGVSQGRLTGGNLAVLCGLMGTPFEIETAGRILLVEDIDEQLYKIDRYLAQLTLSQKLHSAAGILLGDFSFEPKPDQWDADVPRLFDEYFRDLGIPIIGGVRAGHLRENCALPLGALVEIDAHAGRVRVAESPVRARTGAI